MSQPASRILLVDFYPSFRRQSRLLLGKRSALQIVGEASDGIEAVRQAREMKPDIILIDTGLPSLNGIEAARRILKLNPESKIIFVSQKFSLDVVHETFAMGAMGYVLKVRAKYELLAAVDAVTAGRLFLGEGCLEYGPTRQN